MDGAPPGALGIGIPFFVLHGVYHFLGGLPSTKLNMCSSYQLKIKPKLSVYVWMSVLPREYTLSLIRDHCHACSWAIVISTRKGYPCLYPPTGRVKNSRNVVLFENFFPFPNLTSFFYVQQEGSRGVMFIQ